MTGNLFPADSPADQVTGQPASAGTVSGAPRAWLRAEAAVLPGRRPRRLLTTGQPWWLVPALILLPDLAWAGYLGGTRIGAITYNAAHATPLPAVMTGLGWWQHRPLALALGLIWLAHDRPRPTPGLRPQVRPQLPAHSPRDARQKKENLMTPSSRALQMTGHDRQAR